MSEQPQRRLQAAAILRGHFDTEAADAGLRSLDLASAGGGSRSPSPDASAVARIDKRRVFGETCNHRRIRDALRRLDKVHVELLSLAYGCRLRTRDTEDGKKRKAQRQTERNWRVRLAELYGQEGAVVLASPLAKKLFTRHVQALEQVAGRALPALDDRVGTLRTKDMVEQETESAEQLFARARSVVLSGEALESNAIAATVASRGLIGWLLDAGRQHSAAILSDAQKHLDVALDKFADAYGVVVTPSGPRTRSSAKTRERILASHNEHGHKFGQ
jgi:hypothetical protein